EGVAESVEGGRGGCGARLVELGGGAVGVGDGEVDADAGGGGDDGDGDVRVAAHGDERVPGRGGEHRGRGHPAGGEDAGDVDPLAARGVVDGGDAVDPADGERAGQRGGAVDRRVHGERDDHGSRTSISRSWSASASGPVGAASVTRTSTASSGAKPTRNSWPILAESASTTTRRAAPHMAVLTAASSGSWVVSPRSPCRPLVPRNATSTRIASSARITGTPTQAPVSPRTCPPRRWSRSVPARWRESASGTELVTTVRS